MATETIEDIYELTPLQQGMLFHTLLEPERQLYFEQIVVPFGGALHWHAFQRLRQDLVDHHEVLRTSFHWEAIEKPVQVVHASAVVDVAAVDLLGSSRDTTTKSVEDILRADRAQGFALDRPPLLRVKLLRVGPTDYQLIMSFHHMILDGWSLQHLFRDFAAAYRGRASGNAVRLPRARPYRDYLVWLQSQHLEEAESFWRQTMRGYPGPVTKLSSKPPSDNVAAFGEFELELTAETTAAVARAAARLRLTASTITYGAWACTVAQMTGSDDVVFGMTVSGRPAEFDDVESMVGLFINTIPVRAKLSFAESLASWLVQLQHQLLHARQFEFTPLVEIQEWSDVPRGLPLFDNIVAFENYPVSLKGDTFARVPATFAERTNYPLSAAIVPAERMQLRLLYDRRHFDAERVEGIARRFEMIVEAITRNSSQTIGELPTLTDDDRRRSERFNETRTPYPDGTTVHRLFEQRAATRPDAIALEFGERCWTFAELDRLANQLAHRLRSLGVRRGARVALLLERSAELVTAMLATLKAGGAYVPLDPANPLARLQSIVADTSPVVTVGSEDMATTVSGLGTTALLLDREFALLRAERADHVDDETGPDDMAYAMYTSGSTGRPKGIAVPHRAIVRLVSGANYLQVGPDDRVGHLSNSAFDAATFEIWAPLLHGGCVVGIDHDVALSPPRLADFIASRDVSVLFLTTALFNQVAGDTPDAFRPLRCLLFGGETVDPGPVRAVLDAGPPARLLHVYGPTESTTFATWHEVRDVPVGATTVPIGRPISNTTAYVLDPELRPTPEGAIGELYLGGDGLAHGYLGQPGLTVWSFVPDATGHEPGGRLYRTGDRVRMGRDGIEFIGRFDEQVKLRGFRIEPSEIEHAINSFPGVRQCVVLLRHAHDGTGELVAYVAADERSDLRAGLTRVLHERLPRYMHPSAIVVLPSLPINSNGKLDRGALPDPDSSVRDETDRVLPRTGTQSRLASIWCDVLGLDTAGIRDDFFESGGHSLRATQLLSRVRHEFGTELELRVVFEAPTIEQLANLLDACVAASPVQSAPSITAVPREARRRRLATDESS